MPRKVADGWKKLERTAAAYRVNLRVLAAIYLFSFIPVWGGAALMIGASGLLDHGFRSPLRACDFRNGTVMAGAGIHMVGWLLPYLYIEIRGKGLPWYAHAGVALLLGLGVAAFCW